MAHFSLGREVSTLSLFCFYISKVMACPDFPASHLTGVCLEPQMTQGALKLILELVETWRLLGQNKYIFHNKKYRRGQRRKATV